MVKILKYEMKRFIYEKKYIGLLIVVIILPILVVTLGSKDFSNYEAHSKFGIPYYIDGKREDDKHKNWEHDYEEKIESAKKSLEKMNFINEFKEDFASRTQYELEEIFSARCQLLYYTTLKENNIAPYDWRSRYLGDLTTERIEVYGKSKESKKERKKIDSKIKKLISNPWKEVLSGGQDIGIAFTNTDVEEDQYGISAKLYKCTREHNQFLIDNDIVPNKHESNWKYSLALMNREYNQRIIEAEFAGRNDSEYRLTNDQVKVLQSKINRNLYCIKNDIIPLNEGSKYDFILKMDDWLLSVILVLILLFGISVSVDMKEGIYKNLIMRVKGRNKIIIGKLLFYIAVTFLAILFFFLTSVVTANIVFDDELISNAVVEIGNNSFTVFNVYLLVFIKFILYVLPAIFWLIFVFLFVVFFESGEFAILFSMFCVGVFELMKFSFKKGFYYTFEKFIPMYNLNFSRFIYADTLYPYNDFTLSLVQYFIYLAILYILLIRTFKRYQG